MSNQNIQFNELVHICPLDELNISIQQKYKEPIKYYCNLSRKKIEGYQINSKPLDRTYFDNLSPDKFIDSTVGNNKKNIIDINIRSSKILKESGLSFSFKYEYSDRCLNIKKIKPLQNNLECKLSYHIDLIKYEVGDHFNEFHYDTLKDNNVATILIYPPYSMSGKYVGGDLIFKINDFEHRIEPSKFEDKFICVIFGKVLHKCEPVIEGTRYVIKSSIKSELPNILSDENRIKLSDLDINIDDDFIKKQKIDNEIKMKDLVSNIKQIFKEYQNIKTEVVINDIDNNNCPKKLNLDYDDYNDNIKDRLKELESEYMVLLQKINSLKVAKNISNDLYKYNFVLKENKHNFCVLPLYITNMNNFIEYPHSLREYLINLIKNGWNITHLYDTYSFKTDFEEGYKRLTYSNLFNFDNDYQKYNLNYKYDDIMNGKQVSHYSQYNDQSGDDIYEEYECSCLIIWK